MVEVLFEIISLTFRQLIGVLGIFFAMGFLLSIIQHKTHELYTKAVGWKGILWTAWIGTPIHEFGHVIFCKIFRHRVHEVVIFQPNQETGGLGHVNHSYNKKSLYQQIGNFFIGAAPLITGGCFVTLLLIGLVPNGREVLSYLQSGTTLTNLVGAIMAALWALFSFENITRWEFWIFVYVSFAIISHMAPSKPDQKGMWIGFFWIVVLLLVINTLMYWFGIDISSLILKNNVILTTGTMIGIYALTLSLIHLLIVIAVSKFIFRR